MKYSSAITVTQSCGDLTRLPFSRGFGHSAIIIFDSSLNLTLSEEFDKRFKKGIRRYVRVSLIMSRGCINKCGVTGSINLGCRGRRAALAGPCPRLIKLGAASSLCKHTNDWAAPCEALTFDCHVLINVSSYSRGMLSRIKPQE